MPDHFREHKVGRQERHHRKANRPENHVVGDEAAANHSGEWTKQPDPEIEVRLSGRPQPGRGKSFLELRIVVKSQLRTQKPDGAHQALQSRFFRFLDIIDTPVPCEVEDTLRLPGRSQHKQHNDQRITKERGCHDAHLKQRMHTYHTFTFTILRMMIPPTIINVSPA